jgi:hypothetical protein
MREGEMKSELKQRLDEITREMEKSGAVANYGPDYFDNVLLAKRYLEAQGFTTFMERGHMGEAHILWIGGDV